jgi:hypothetical protein
MSKFVPEELGKLSEAENNFIKERITEVVAGAWTWVNAEMNAYHEDRTTNNGQFPTHRLADYFGRVVGETKEKEAVRLWLLLEREAIGRVKHLLKNHIESYYRVQYDALE